MNKIVKIGILTASDRAYKGIYEDLSGKAIIDTLNLYLKTKWEAEYRLVSDEFEDIKNTLLELSKKMLFNTYYRWNRTCKARCHT